MEAYLDNAATTRVFPEVRDIMLQVMEKDFGNPSSRHTKGIEAEGYVTKAVQQIAGTLKCQPKEIILTSGGTESNNMALIGTALANQRAGKHVITTRIEHASIHEPFGRLEQMGYEAQYLPVDHNGHLQPEVLEEAVREDTLLVSVMMVNNEMGAVEDIKKLVAVAKQKNPNVIFHVDAIQAYGKYKIVPKRLGIDLMSVSGHKIHGPKGSGFLYVRDGVKISPIILGGGQQRGMRSGTENVPAIAGLGEAVRLIYQQHSEKVERLYALKQRLIDGLTAMEGVSINGINGLSLTETAPHIVSASFDGIKSEVMLHALAQEGVYVSSGSACSSNHPDLSGTLKAIGVEDRLLDSTLRFSFSVLSTEEEVDHALEAVAKVLPQLRRFVKK
ncbi:MULTISPECIES: cysteine desulfurase family protein [Jutongia]|jgi:cysteine desulfurase|uniref:Cysteine desulfurase n=1 Tax=Jutongia huaianensis TaxID=2763668 RepID=A0ABR7MY35_9FIRM|nr:cysteine desulfurase family protein [Jutongia huaianensis]MBC8561289.1 cysteine desulfurase [Jutongia huaianensis]CDE68512.1 cysteine sulfinate desulfinase/cysteine desulfurase and related enzymes [Clostridium sp. CAG:277]